MIMTTLLAKDKENKFTKNEDILTKIMKTTVFTQVKEDLTVLTKDEEDYLAKDEKD